MSTIGKIQLTIIYIAPPEIVEEGERVFEKHAEWMERTHVRDGELALLRYNIIKSPELEDPFNPSSEPTGNTMFVLDEMYETQAGLDEHWRMAREEWEDVQMLVDWSAKCKAVTAHNGVAIQGLW